MINFKADLGDLELPFKKKLLDDGLKLIDFFKISVKNYVTLSLRLDVKTKPLVKTFADQKPITRDSPFIEKYNLTAPTLAKGGIVPPDAPPVVLDRGLVSNTKISEQISAEMVRKAAEIKAKRADPVPNTDSILPEGRYRYKDNLYYIKYGGKLITHGYPEITLDGIVYEMQPLPFTRVLEPKVEHVVNEYIPVDDQIVLEVDTSEYLQGDQVHVDSSNIHEMPTFADIMAEAGKKI